MRLAPILGATALTLATAIAPTAAHGQRAAEAEALIDHWIEALGGMDSYHRVRSATYTATTELYDPETGRLRSTRPRYVWIARDETGLFARVERWEGDDFIQQGWSPEGQWASMNGEPLAEGDKDWDEADYVGGDLNYWIFLPFKLNDPGVNLHYEADDGEERQLVTVTFGQGVGTSSDTWRYHFEEGRTWPAQVSYQTERGTRANPMRWEDIGVADGFFYVGSRVYLNPEGRVRMIIRLGDVSINPELDPELFRRP